VTLEPAPVYRFIYPFEEASLRRLAYHFDMRSAELERVGAYTAPAAREFRAWQEHKDASALAVEELGDALKLSDARWGRRHRNWLLKDADAAILRLCWRITARHAIDKAVAQSFGAKATQAALKRLIARGFLLQEGEQFLALPLRQPGFRRAPTWAEIRASRTVPYLLREFEPRRAAGALA